MHFRVTDERNFQAGFDAESPASLADGIRLGCEKYAAHGGNGTLRLHVWGRTPSANGIWLTPTENPTAPRVTATEITYSDRTNMAIVVSTDACEPLFALAERMVAHHENLMGLGDRVSDVIAKLDGPPVRSN